MLSDDPIISKVVLRYKFWPKRKDFVPPIERVPLFREQSQDVEKKKPTLSIFSVGKYLFLIFKGLLMKDWKTTVTGVVGAAAVLINHFTGLQIPEAPLVAVIVFVIGWFAGDSKK